MNSKLWSALVLGFILTSCQIGPVPETEVTPVVHEPTLQSGEVVVFGRIISPGNDTSQTTSENAIKEVKNIATISDLKKFNTNAQDFGSGSLEVQKNQLLLAIKMSELQDPQFMSLKTRYENTMKGKDIWPETLITAEKAYIANMQAPKTGSEISLEKDAFVKQFAEFRKTKEYIEYLNSQKENLEKLEASMRIYYTPEMKELDEKIMKIRNGSTINR